MPAFVVDAAAACEIHACFVEHDENSHLTFGPRSASEAVTTRLSSQLRAVGCHTKHRAHRACCWNIAAAGNSAPELLLEMHRVVTGSHLLTLLAVQLEFLDEMYFKIHECYRNIREWFYRKEL